MGESEGPSQIQKEKRRSAKSDVLKVLFPDMEKITNRQQTTVIWFFIHAMKSAVFGFLAPLWISRSIICREGKLDFDL